MKDLMETIQEVQTKEKELLEEHLNFLLESVGIRTKDENGNSISIEEVQRKTEEKNVTVCINVNAQPCRVETLVKLIQNDEILREDIFIVEYDIKGHMIKISKGRIM